MAKARQRGQAAALQRVLGQNVFELREAAGMNQESLADRSRLSRSYVSRIEAGKVNVTLSTVIQLARALGVDPLYLLNSRQAC